MRKVKCKVIDEEGYKIACDMYPQEANLKDFVYYYTGQVYKYLEKSESFIIIDDRTKEFKKVPIINCIDINS